MHDRDTTSDGAVIVEFLIAIIVFCFLCVIAAELGYTLQVRQVMATITREASITAFKECSRIDNPLSRRICMANIVVAVGAAIQQALRCDKMPAPAGSTKPNCPEVMLSIYEEQVVSGVTSVVAVSPVVGTGPTPTLFTYANDSTGGFSTSGGFPSKFTAADARFGVGGSLRTLMDQNKRVVICEVFWQYKPWLPALRTFLPLGLGKMYDSDII